MRIVILGAGFAGIRIAKAVQARAHVTLVAPSDRFVYLPLIHEMLADRQTPTAVSKPLHDILPGTEHVHASAVAVAGQEVVLDDGRRIGFDRLVVAVGAEPNDFGLPGVREHTHSFYSIRDALLANAALKIAAAEISDRPVRVAVAGASFTGVEVAAEAVELLRTLAVPHEVTLLDAMPEIFPHQPQAFRNGIRKGIDALGMALRLEQRIAGVEPGKVLVEGGGAVQADVIFWCAGTRPRHVDGVSTEVRPTLQSVDRDDVYIAGDAARFPREAAVPRLAQTAEQQARVVAHNLLHDERRDYTADVKGLIVSVGHDYAVAEIRGQVLTGKVPLHIKRQLYKAKIRMT